MLGVPKEVSGTHSLACLGWVSQGPGYLPKGSRRSLIPVGVVMTVGWSSYRDNLTISAPYHSKIKALRCLLVTNGHSGFDVCQQNNVLLMDIDGYI